VPRTSCSIQCQEGIGGRIGRQEEFKMTIRTIVEVVIVVIVVYLAVRFFMKRG
jgi:predicted nucleic acid-binding Zn ribbon protein